MTKVQVNLGERSYTIHIGMDTLASTGRLIREITQRTRVAVISDERVAALYGKSVMQACRDAGIQGHLFTVPGGEGSKSLSQTENLYTQLIEGGFHRDCLIAALGGGVVGDLAGFTAATYLRGVSFIQIPTTLLAQVDSSVGGKVGINHALGKNLIGSFYQPQFVLIDPSVLQTLDRREMWAGMAEVVKYGLIWNSGFYEFLEEKLESLAGLENWDDITHMLALCCRAKADVVEADEKEGGLRRILNFGHTLGHALESVTGYGWFRHGEAVVYGMRWAAWVSCREKKISVALFRRIDALLKRIPVPSLPDDLDRHRMMERIGVDKKQTSGGLKMVLLDDIGRTAIVSVKDVSSWVNGWFEEVLNG